MNKKKILEQRFGNRFFLKQIETINHFISGILKSDKQILQDLRKKNVNDVRQLLYYQPAYYDESYHFEDTNVQQRHSVL